MNEQIIQYIRAGRGRNPPKANKRIGVLVGQKDSEGVVRIGWSKANLAAGDTFDAKMGLDIALGRIAHSRANKQIPNSIYPQYAAFALRCSRYFKDAKKIVYRGVEI